MVRKLLSCECSPYLYISPFGRHMAIMVCTTQHINPSPNYNIIIYRMRSHLQWQCINCVRELSYAAVVYDGQKGNNNNRPINEIYMYKINK